MTTHMISLSSLRSDDRTTKLLDALGAAKLNSHWMIREYSTGSHAESVDAVEARLDEVDRQDAKPQGAWRELLSVARVG